MTATEKLAAAIAYLDKRWVLHPSRRVPKGSYEHPVMRCNVEETFARERKRLAKEKA